MPEYEEILQLLHDPRNRFDPAFIQRMIDLIDPIAKPLERPLTRPETRVNPSEGGIPDSVPGSLGIQA